MRQEEKHNLLLEDIIIIPLNKKILLLTYCILLQEAI